MKIFQDCPEIEHRLKTSTIQGIEHEALRLVLAPNEDLNFHCSAFDLCLGYLDRVRSSITLHFYSQVMSLVTALEVLENRKT